MAKPKAVKNKAKNVEGTNVELLVELKARAYDIVVRREQLTAELQQVNQQIVKLLQENEDSKTINVQVKGFADGNEIRTASRCYI